MVEVDEDIGEDHQGERFGGGLLPLDALSYLFLHPDAILITLDYCLIILIKTPIKSDSHLIFSRPSTHPLESSFSLYLPFPLKFSPFSMNCKITPFELLPRTSQSIKPHKNSKEQ